MDTYHLCLDWASSCLRSCTRDASCRWEETGVHCNILESREFTPYDRDSLAELDRFLREDWDPEGWEERLRGLAEAYGRSVFRSSKLKVGYRKHMRGRHSGPIVVEHRVPDGGKSDEMAALSAPSEFWTWGEELALLVHPIFKRLSPEAPLTSYNGPLLFPDVPDVVLLVAGEPPGFGNPSADDIVEGVGDIWEAAARNMAKSRDKRPQIIKLHSDQVTRERVRAVIEDPFSELEEMDQPAPARDLLGMIHWVGRSAVAEGRPQGLHICGESDSRLQQLSPRNLAMTLASARDREVRWQFFFLCCYRDSQDQDPIPAPGYARVLEPLVLQGGVPCALGLTRPVSRGCADHLASEFYHRLLTPYCADEPLRPNQGVPEAVFDTRRTLYQDVEEGTEPCYYGWAAPILIMQRARQTGVSLSRARVRAEDQAYIAGRIRRGECCSVVAPAHMGKSSLLRSVLTQQTLRTCAAKGEAPPLAVFVDCLVVDDEPDFYGLLLDEILIKLREADVPQATIDSLVASHRDVLQARNARAAWAHFRTGMCRLFRELPLKVVLLLDEFDDVFSELSPRPFRQLRALYDKFKPNLCYVTATARSMEAIRPEDKMLYFRELFLRYTRVLYPLSEDDCEQMLTAMVGKRGTALDRDRRSRIIALSGGHPGLLKRIYELVELEPGLLERMTAAALSERPEISHECETLWNKLEEEEQENLRQLIADGESGLDTTQRRRLREKRLIVTERTGGCTVFSPILGAFIGRELKTGVICELDTGRVFVDGRDVTEALDPQPRELVRLLWQKKGDVCTHEEIRAALWRDEGHGGSRNVYIVVQRARDVIEPDPDDPTYILNVWGRGYRLHLPNQG